MNNAESFVNKAVREVARILLPLRRLDSRERITYFLRELGWEFPGNDPFPATFGSLINSITGLQDAVYQLEDASSDTEILTKTKALWENIKSTTKSIAGLKTEIEQVLAGSQVVIDFRDKSGILKDNEFMRRLMDYLIIDYLQSFRSQWYNALYLLGLIENIPKDPDSSSFQPDFTLRRIHWDRASIIFKEPLSLAETVYNWQSGFNSDKFFENIDLLLRAFLILGGIYEQDPVVHANLKRLPEDVKELRIPLYQSGRWYDKYIEAGISLASVPPSDYGGKGLAILPYLLGIDQIKTDINSSWQIAFSGVDSLDDIALVIQPPKQINPDSNTLSSPVRINLISNISSNSAELPDFDATLKLTRKSDNGKIILFGSSESSRLSVKDFGFTLSASKSSQAQDISIEMEIKELCLVIASNESDGFLQKVFPPEGLIASSEIALGWSYRRGLYFRGSAGLEMTQPVQTDLGGILKVDSIYLSIKTKGTDILVATAATASVKLGPITATVERIGLEAAFTLPLDGGNLGPAHVDLRYRPPDGAGISLDSSVIVGGGYLFFDPDKEEYAGILQLEIQDVITLKAIGLLTTRLPDGSKGFSLLVIITAEGFTSIQLGFGFTLNGVGGLLGVNRTAMVDVLRSGIKNHTMDSILFPKDPIRNAPQIISDLRTVFPPVENRYLIGPMAIIGWGTPTILTIELGIVLELPSPVRLIILGKLTAILPSQEYKEEAIVRIHMDALGIINFDRSEVSLDATLYDSTIMQFTLTGDMALRANWGANPSFILAVGGFNPRYNAPLGFPRLKRVAISMSSGDKLRLGLEAYFALTSNTVQIGARLDLYAAAGSFSIEGYLGFDALFQFSPFQFIADFGGWLALRYDGEILMSVKVDMTLSGPSPWHAVGKATFEILGFEKSIEFNRTFGPAVQPAIPEPIDVYPMLIKELKDKRNWNAQLPATGHMLITLRKIPESDEVLVHPLGDLKVHQRIVPLMVEISRFGNTTPSGQRRFEITSTQLGNTSKQPDPEKDYIKDNFARAQFFEMSDDEKLSSPSFESMKAGVHIGSDNITFCKKDPVSQNCILLTTLKYDTLVIDSKGGESSKSSEYTMSSDALDAQVGLGAAGQAAIHRTGIAKFRTPGPDFKLKDTSYVVASTDKVTIRKDILDPDIVVRPTYTIAVEALRKHLDSHPEDRGRLQVVASHEGVRT